MRLLVVLAHPLEDSLSAAAAARLRDCGHETQLLDLYAMGFDPVLRAEGVRAYDQPEEDLAPHLAALAWAEAVVLVYPTWWSGPPAMLKGWLDRVMRPGVAFRLEAGLMRPALSHIRHFGVVTSLGSPWWLWTFVLGAPGRKMLLRGLRACFGRRCGMFWMALHGMDHATPEARTRFLDRVARKVTALR